MSDFPKGEFEVLFLANLKILNSTTANDPNCSIKFCTKTIYYNLFQFLYLAVRIYHAIEVCCTIIIMKLILELTLCF